MSDKYRSIAVYFVLPGLPGKQDHDAIRQYWIDWLKLCQADTTRIASFDWKETPDVGLSNTNVCVLEMQDWNGGRLEGDVRQVHDCVIVRVGVHHSDTAALRKLADPPHQVLESGRYLGRFESVADDDADPAQLLPKSTELTDLFFKSGSKIVTFRLGDPTVGRSRSPGVPFSPWAVLRFTTDPSDFTRISLSHVSLTSTDPAALEPLLVDIPELVLCRLKVVDCQKQILSLLRSLRTLEHDLRGAMVLEMMNHLAATDNLRRFAKKYAAVRGGVEQIQCLMQTVDINRSNFRTIVRSIPFEDRDRLFVQLVDRFTRPSIAQAQASLRYLRISLRDAEVHMRRCEVEAEYLEAAEAAQQTEETRQLNKVLVLLTVAQMTGLVPAICACLVDPPTKAPWLYLFIMLILMSGVFFLALKFVPQFISQSRRMDTSAPHP